MSHQRDYWNERYRQGWSMEPCEFLLSWAERLPATGQALDIAGGSGRNALYLARRGLDTTVVDISSEALAQARSHAAQAGLSLRLIERDLELDSVPPGPWQLVCNFYYLQRSLIPRLGELLSDEGLLLFAHATRINLERHQRPGPTHVLAPGELARLTQDLEHIYYEEAWFAEGRHEARLVARRG